MARRRRHARDITERYQINNKLVYKQSTYQHSSIYQSKVKVYKQIIPKLDDTNTGHRGE